VKKAAEILARILEEKGREIGTTYSSVFGGWSWIVPEKEPQGISNEQVSEVDRIVSAVSSDELKGHLKRLFLKNIERDRAD